MGTHANAEALLAWLRERSGASVNDFVTAGLMKPRMASDAVQYALRNGALERVVRPGAGARERAYYRATGVALPAPRTAAPCFDALLRAWGMVLEPPRLAAIASHRYRVWDDGQEQDLPQGRGNKAKK